MANESIHELSAAYALHALDSRDEADFEAHLAGCVRCREELASLSETAAALAYAVETPAPPPALRQQLLERAVAERSNVVTLPLRRQRAFQAVAAVAVAAAAAAIGLGTWAAVLHGRTGGTRLSSAQEAVLRLAADPQTRRASFDSGRGTLYVAPDGEAGLALAKVPAVPSNRQYEAWVIVGGSPKPAALFDPGEPAVPLMRHVPRGATVAVTVEPRGGSKQPHGPPIMQAEA